jgi:large conductance mechanosensitive channel
MKVKLFKEFKEFALRGSVVDLAVGIIIGGALNKIIFSLVNDLLVPFVGVLSGGTDFKALKWTVNGFLGNQVTITYGMFIENIVEFLVIAWVIFVAVKLINRFHRKKQINCSPPSLPQQEQLLIEIRDLLKKR